MIKLRYRNDLKRSISGKTAGDWAVLAIMFVVGASAWGMGAVLLLTDWYGGLTLTMQVLWFLPAAASILIVGMTALPVLGFGSILIAFAIAILCTQPIRSAKASALLWARRQPHVRTARREELGLRKSMAK